MRLFGGNNVLVLILIQFFEIFKIQFDFAMELNFIKPVTEVENYQNDDNLTELRWRQVQFHFVLTSFTLSLIWK